MINRDRLINLWPYLFVVGILFIFYFQIFIVKGAWLVADHAEQHYPWAFYLAENIKNGVLPFWTDQIHSGFPITAEGQIGTFYLPNLLFYYLFPIQKGYAWNIAFHLILSGLFMVRYLKTLGIENRGVFFGTMVYLFGSTLGGAYYNITSLKVFTWFPLTLILVDRILAKERFQWPTVIFLGFLFSLQLLAGYLQYAAYAILFSGLYGLFRAFDFKLFHFKKILIPVLSLVIAVFIAAVIAFPQLFLTYELAIRSNRASPEEGFAYVGSYSPLAMICLFFPSLEGFFVSKLYLGVVSIFFMLVPFFYFKTFKTKSFYFLVVLSLLLALGRYSPLYVLIIKLFKFYSFRTPVKFIFFTGFFLSVLSAYGMQIVFKQREASKVQYAGRTYINLLIAVTFTVLISYIAFRFFNPQLYQLGEWLVAQIIYGQPGHPFGWEHYQEKLIGFLKSGTSVLDPRNKIIWIPVLKMIASAVLIAVFLKKRLTMLAFFVGVIVLLVIDLNFTYSDIRGDYESYQSFEKESEIEIFLKENLNGARYFIYSQNPSEAPLPASKNMIHDLKTVNAYSPLVSKDYYDFFSYFRGINDSVGYQTVDDDYFIEQLKLLGMLNVKYIVTDRKIRSGELAKVFSDGAWDVYDNPYVIDKFSLVPSYEVFSDRGDLLGKLRDKSFNPSITSLLEREIPAFFGIEDSAVISDHVEIVEQGSERVVLSASSKKDQILLLSNFHYPGWSARVDGIETPILRANYILSAIPVKRGQHRVVLTYSPLTHFIKKS